MKKNLKMWRSPSHWEGATGGTAGGAAGIGRWVVETVHLVPYVSAGANHPPPSLPPWYWGMSPMIGSRQ